VKGEGVHSVAQESHASRQTGTVGERVPGYVVARTRTARLSSVEARQTSLVGQVPSVAVPFLPKPVLDIAEGVSAMPAIQRAGIVSKLGSLPRGYEGPEASTAAGVLVRVPARRHIRHPNRRHHSFEV